MVVLYSRCCSAGFRSTGVFPLTCPTCGLETKWTSAPFDAPRVPYNLTPLDKRFLRSGSIDPEEDGDAHLWAVDG